MAYTYDPIFAADPNNTAMIAKDAAIIIFDPADVTMAAVTITDVTGSPLTNPVVVNKSGFGPAFQHPTLDRVGWSGGGFTGYFTSYEGMKTVATDAQVAAEAAQTAAETAGVDAAAVASAALADAVADADAAAASAAASAALVGAPADAAITAAINNGASATRGALNATILDLGNANFVREDATAMQGRGMYVSSDSFGIELGGVAPYAERIDAARSMNYVTSAVGGQFFQDGFGRNWGTGATVNPGTPADAFCLLSFGINPAYHRGDVADARTAEKYAFESLLWLLSSQSITASTDWTLTGTWSNYTGSGAENMRGGAAQSTDTNGSYAEITPSAGDYAAIGYSFSAGIGAEAQSGEYQKNTVTVAETFMNPGNGNSPATQNGSLIIPVPVRLLGLTGTDVIRAERIDGNGYMFVDSLIKLSATPPWIIVVKPTYVALDSSYPTTDAEIDAYRADIDSVIASVTAAYPPLRGKIIVVDPVTSGWDRNAHTSADGLHPDEDGHKFLAWLVQRQVAYAVRLRQQLLTTGQLTA